MIKRLEALQAIGRPFWLLWLGQTISLVGSQLASFAMGVWVYQQTGSVLTLAGSAAAAILPALLMVPIAGSMVDNLDRRLVMIAADAVSATLTFFVLILLWMDSLAIWHLYLFTSISSLCAVFQIPAYQASVAQMVEASSMTRASGAMSVSASTLAIGTPALAGALLPQIGLTGMVLIDLVSFICGTGFVWRAFWLSRGREVRSGGVRNAILASMDSFVNSVWFFFDNSTMRLVLMYSVLQAGMFALVTILITPLVLATHSVRDLGITLSFEAMGSLAGGLALVLLPSPKRRMLLILVCDVLISLCIILAGFAQALGFLWALFSIAGFAGTVAGGCVYAIWMNYVPPERHGSILSTTAAASMICTLTILLVGGAIVDFVFDPAMASDGALARTVGEWIGVGKGRGMALMFVVAGTLSFLCTMSGFTSRRLRELA